MGTLHFMLAQGDTGGGISTPGLILACLVVLVLGVVVGFLVAGMVTKSTLSSAK